MNLLPLLCNCTGLFPTCHFISIGFNRKCISRGKLFVFHPIRVEISGTVYTSPMGSCLPNFRQLGEMDPILFPIKGRTFLHLIFPPCHWDKILKDSLCQVVRREDKSNFFLKEIKCFFAPWGPGDIPRKHLQGSI